MLLSARPLSSSLRSSGACWTAWWIMWGPTSASPSRRPHAWDFMGIHQQYGIWIGFYRVFMRIFDGELQQNLSSEFWRCWILTKMIGIVGRRRTIMDTTNDDNSNDSKCISYTCIEMNIMYLCYLSKLYGWTLGWLIYSSQFGDSSCRWFMTQATEEEYHNMMRTNVDSCWFLCTMAESPAFNYIYIYII